MNFSIRLSTKRRSALHTIFEILLAICFTINQRQRFSVSISDGVGFTENCKIKSGHTLLIGYFQSWRYAERLAKVFDGSEIRLKNHSESFEVARHFFESKKWRLVHIRLGDYLLSDQITLQDEFEQAETFVFTNDELTLRKMSTELYSFLPDLSLPLSSSELLLLWTSASQFVISNSTFSWWSAYLSRKCGMYVIAPDPWFKRAQTPNQLIFTEWKGVISRFVEEPN